MGAARDTRHHHRVPQLHRALAATKRTEVRKYSGDRTELQRLSIQRQLHRMEDSGRISLLLVLRHNTITIAIDLRDDHVGDGNAWRQIELKFDALRFDGEPGRLKKLVG